MPDTPTPAKQEEATFPLGKVLAAAGGFLALLVLINLLPHNPASEMPPIAAPTRPLPALAGLSPERKEGEIRIFVIGASLSSGYPYQPVPAASYTTLLGKGLTLIHGDRQILCRPAAKPALDSPRLAEMVDEILAYRPTLVCITLGPNELANRIFFGRPLRPPGLVERLTDRLSRGRLLWRRLWEGLRPGRADEQGEEFQQKIAGKILQARPARPAILGLPVSSADQELLIRRMELAMGRMAASCRRAGVPLVFLIGVNNLAGSWPFTVLEGAEQEQTDDLIRIYRRGGSPDLLARTRALLSRAPERGDLHFLLGRLLLEGGRKKEARQALARARDLDQAPMHLTGGIRQAIRRRAKELGAHCLDMQEALLTPADQGIPDPELFLDYVHLNLEGHVLVATFLAEQLTNLCLLPPLKTGWRRRFKAALWHHIDQEIQPESRRRAVPNMAWARGNFYLLFGNFRDALPAFCLAFARGCTGDPVKDGPLVMNLLFCAYSLAGRAGEVQTREGEDGATRFNQVYRKLCQAAAKGTVSDLAQRILDGGDP